MVQGAIQDPASVRQREAAGSSLHCQRSTGLSVNCKVATFSNRNSSADMRCGENLQRIMKIPD